VHWLNVTVACHAAASARAEALRDVVGEEAAPAAKTRSNYSFWMRTLSAVLAIILSCAIPRAAHAGPGAATITFLHFNDVYEITPVEAGNAGGLARVARLRDTLKAQHPELITTLAGDYVSPSAVGTARVNGERLAGKQMVGVLNALGLDWATLGNHEFDIAEAGLLARLAEAKFHVVSSNVTDRNGQPFAGTVTHAVVPVKTGGRTVRIGLLGLTIDSNKQPWVRYAPPLESARAAVAALQAEHCDAIVALTHLTLATDREIAEEVPEIDLILGGHEHENWVVERGPRFTSIVKADSNVRTVAVVTLSVPPRRAGDSDYAHRARADVTTKIVTIDRSIKDQPRTAAEVKKWTDLAYRAFREQGFDPAEVIKVVDRPLRGTEAAVRNGPTTLTDLICDAMRHEAGTEIAILNAGSIRIDDVLIPGPVTQLDVIRVLPFGGPVVRATVTGALLSRVLAIGQRNKGSGGFLLTAGLPASIDPAAHYTVAFTDFLLTGGEANLGFLKRGDPEVSDVTDLRDIRQALIDELKRR
jgi:5'-nucleotidase/UDP-sugar diphosphatase